jgi:hypothetical protein
MSPAAAQTLIDEMAATSAGLTTDLSRPYDPWTAGAQGYLGWTYDPAYTVATNQAPTAGVEYLCAFRATTSGPVTKIYFDGTNTPGSMANTRVGLRAADGTLLQKSADLSTALNGAASALRSATITSTNLVAGTLYYVAFVCGSATTMIQMSRGAAPGNLGNSGLTAATYRWAVNGTGKTDLGASVTMSSNTAGLALWFAVGN